MSFPTQSIDFERSSAQYAAINDTGLLDLADAMTFEVWINLESNPGAYVMGKRVGTGNQRSYSFSVTGGTLEAFFDNTGSGGAGKTASVSWSPSTATYYHIAVTKSGTSVRFYVDGVQQGTTQSISNSAIFNSTAPFEIGSVSSEYSIIEQAPCDHQIHSQHQRIRYLSQMGLCY